MTENTRVALYLRQSKAAEGDELAIDRQREGCLTLAERHGWTIDPAHVYVDNNVSASSAKARPAYARLVADVRSRKIDVVIAWNLDRLTRKPREIEDWLDMHETVGVNLMTSEQRELIDLSTETGRMMLRINASVARFEVERKSRRQKNSNAQAREKQFPPNGRRAFGYTTLKPGARAITVTRYGPGNVEYPDYGHELVPREAEAIQRGYDLVLAGASLGSIARMWNEAGHLTTNGAPWTQTTVRGVLTSPRYAAFVAEPRQQGTAGHRTSRYDLTTLTTGSWEPIVPVETWVAANDVLRNPSRRAVVGAPRRWLLSGIATCGSCGAPMKAGATRDKVPTYRCSSSNHLSRKALDADELVTEVVIARLSRPDAAELLIDNDAPDLGALRSEMLAVQSSMKNVAELVADNTLTPSAARETVGRLRARSQVIESKMTHAGKGVVLGPLVATNDVRKAWQDLTVEMQRKVVSTLMTVVMTSPGKGSRAPHGDAERLAYTARSVILTPSE